MARITLPPGSAPQDILNAMRGATNVVKRCLQIAEGERVHLLTLRADSVYELMARAVADAGAIAVRIELEAIHAELASNPAAVVARLESRLTEATATILLAPDGPSPALSMAIAQVAERKGVRHLHLLGVDERVLAPSARAAPDLLATVNARLVAALELPCQIRVTSEGGTDLDVRLAHPHPIVSSNGQPAPGASENLPAGLVYTHPARVSGSLVVDRALFGPEVTLDRGAIRRAPVRLRFGSNRVDDFDAADPAIARALEAYLTSHADAGRVGMVVLPSNYLVRSEVGIDRQDMLLPGMNVSLGHTNAAVTRATYEAPVQMILLGRRQTVEVGRRRLVEAGRLEDALVDGIDPFR
jgi:hypothetical protein